MTAPYLTALNGCTEPVGKVLVVLGDVSFQECPARFATAADEEVVDLALARALERVTPFERAALPSGLVEAVEYVTSILPRTEDDDAR